MSTKSMIDRWHPALGSAVDYDPAAARFDSATGKSVDSSFNRRLWGQRGFRYESFHHKRPLFRLSPSGSGRVRAPARGLETPEERRLSHKEREV